MYQHITQKGITQYFESNDIISLAYQTICETAKEMFKGQFLR